MRSRKIASDRLISKNHLDTPTRADCSSSVSSLDTFLADTCDKPRSAVKNSLSSRIAATRTNSYVAHCLPTIAFNDVLDGQSLLFILAMRSSTMRTVCQPISKYAMQLVYKLLRHILYLSVLCICFNICMGVIPPRYINSLLYFRPLRRHKSSFSSIFKRQWCMYNLRHSYINNVRR